jgi:hypothetical protein
MSTTATVARSWLLQRNVNRTFRIIGMMVSRLMLSTAKYKGGEAESLPEGGENWASFVQV